MTERTLIGRVRVAGADPLLTQLRTAHLLNSADLRPAALPPGAILFVRRLRDPLPGALVIGEALPARAWERAVHSALDDLLRRAARPMHGLAPASAEAVLFADQAELLACLALDWLGGLLPGRWWWAQALRRADSPRQAVMAAWLDAPECVPAALAHLHAQDAAVAFGAALSEPEAETLLRLVIARFGLHHLADLLPMNAVSSQPRRESEAAAALTPPDVMRPARAAPWAQALPRQAQTLSAACQLLLGVSLTLVRQPQTARGAAFALAVRRWLGEPVPPQSVTDPVQYSAPHGRAEMIASEIDAPALLHQAELPPDTLAAALPTQPADAPQSAPEAVAIEGQVPLTVVEPPLSAEAAASENAPLFEAEIETAFGGLFYLLNLALRLGLYGDFTLSESDDIDLPIWDFLALLGESFLGAALHDDPVWALLARLSGRAPDAPGAGFAPPDEWLIPRGWLDAFEPAPCAWSLDDGRLRVWMPDGFWLADVPAEADTLAQLRTLYSDYPLQPGAVPLPRAGALERWADWMAAYARARLRAALDMPPDADLNAVLFRHQARIRLAAARLDIFLKLHDLPVAIRLAGLDRNPGWIPAAGRGIAFHFE